ncbi:TPA: hypothetical protein N2742_000730 [Vibrio parahaemolyticus]|uniref:hypothetical protein n=3 Tax=Vibrio parahaemolyticus TaxID=670 RepID=UPI0005F0D1F2|nr:hypothetical protein [Vibrio parahaemolyticus]KJR20445.1 hypothetical protein UF29_08885 [Vibrio parahaemolyticus]HCE2689894.1 hypothetical protein [Vibrio parahaemolyticus]HCE2915017.1 hypothetical protein [Vibrio parahaemolyticus]HCG8556911.1 hypothetical protein [Vibrio parahaemolyticus]HCH0054131.1 hypothetical protein [Vibrio parahaemolyticus]
MNLYIVESQFEQIADECIDYKADQPIYILSGDAEMLEGYGEVEIISVEELFVTLCHLPTFNFDCEKMVNFFERVDGYAGDFVMHDQALYLETYKEDGLRPIVIDLVNNWYNEVVYSVKASDGKTYCIDADLNDALSVVACMQLDLKALMRRYVFGWSDAYSNWLQTGDDDYLAPLDQLIELELSRLTFDDIAEKILPLHQLPDSYFHVDLYEYEDLEQFVMNKNYSSLANSLLTNGLNGLLP